MYLLGLMNIACYLFISFAYLLWLITFTVTLICWYTCGCFGLEVFSVVTSMFTFWFWLMFDLYFCFVVVYLVVPFCFVHVFWLDGLIWMFMVFIVNAFVLFVDLTSRIILLYVFSNTILFMVCLGLGFSIVKCLVIMHLLLCLCFVVCGLCLKMVVDFICFLFCYYLRLTCFVGLWC